MGAAADLTRRVATVVVLAGCVSTLWPAPAQAHAHADPTTPPIPHPGRDYMGSTIADRTSLDEGNPRTMAEIREVQNRAQQAGIDVSHWQGTIDWSAVADDGIKFAYMKATEGTTYSDPSFDDNYTGARKAGLIRGAYHFALPDRSSGAAQGRYFVDNGGDWPKGGKTLPPVLDIEYNPYGETCYGRSDRQMVAWIAEFSSTVKHRSGRYPVIYTTTNWWRRCTGNHGGFADTNPLWIANWGADPSPLPAGWDAHTIWQYTSDGRVAGIGGDVDRDVFNGSYKRLRAFARCADERPC